MSQEKYLCMTDDGHFTHKWCTFEAMDNYSIKVEVSFMVMLIVYAFFIIRYFIRIISLRQGRRGRQFFGEFYLHIYLIMICWLLCTQNIYKVAIIKVIINLIVYIKYMSIDFNENKSQIKNIQKQDNKDVPANSPIVIISLLFNIFDFLCIYSILFLILLIPYQWLTKILQNIKQDMIQSVQIRKNLQIYFTILKIVKIYYKYIRVIFIPLLLCQPFILYYTGFGCQFPTLNYTLVIMESLFILVFYGIGWNIYRFLIKNKLIKILQKDLRKIKIQYSLLNLVLLGRIILNFYFRVSPFYTYMPNINCSDIDEQNKIKATIFLALAHYIMHIMTISIIIYIYRPSIQKSKKTQEKQNLNESMSQQNQIDDNILSKAQAIFGE